MNNHQPPSGTFDDGGSDSIETRINVDGHREGLIGGRWVILEHDAATNDAMEEAVAQFVAITMRAAHFGTSFDTARKQLDLPRNDRWRNPTVRARAEQSVFMGAQKRPDAAQMVEAARAAAASYRP